MLHGVFASQRYHCFISQGENVYSETEKDVRTRQVEFCFCEMNTDFVLFKCLVTHLQCGIQQTSNSIYVVFPLLVMFST